MERLSNEEYRIVEPFVKVIVMKADGEGIHAIENLLEHWDDIKADYGLDSDESVLKLIESLRSS